ncbi:hypothetical protein A9Q84_04875 [Halobacteriovorax marinus]|uniref:Lipoprotein n=1 Tax=Halobacteriovorax marinus TaxID=97084 RepID=A0A1Y5FB77_9BACT|nr:hypothetical protein A9Q84_04875 [Halobacteriovorax marinus]
MKSLVFITIVLSLFTSCKPDQVTNQYNQPKEVVVVPSGETSTPAIKKSLGGFSFDKEISLPVYSKSVEYKADSSLCVISYRHSNLDRSIKVKTILNVKRDSFYISTVYNTFSYTVYFNDNELELSSLSCEIQNGFDIFHNKNMLSTFKEFVRSSKIFSSEEIEANY